MRIAVVSDTHSRYSTVEAALALIGERKVDLILHCGDIDDAETVWLFPGNTHFVFGNCDLDRTALLDLGLRTAIDAVRGTGGRISVRPGPDQPLTESLRHGSLGHVDPMLEEAERTVLDVGDVGEGEASGNYVISVPMGTPESGGYIHGLITVVRPAEPFSGDDRELLRSLAAQATLALENVDLHQQVRGPLTPPAPHIRPPPSDGEERDR